MKYILALVFVLALLVRAPFLTVSPPELFGDEVDVGYQAYSLLHTGRDLYGQILPAYIHSLSEWRTPLLMYFTVPTIALFGKTEYGVRLPEVILGSLAPLILFLLVHQLTKNNLVSLLSSLALVFMPWHILYSRVAFESVLLLDFIMLGTLLFLKKHVHYSLLLLLLTPYIYSTATVFMPVWLTFLFIWTKTKIRFSYLLLLLLLTPFALSLFTGHAAERFGKVGLFNNSQITDDLSTSRNESTAPWEKLFTNRPAFVLRKIYDNYLSAFSPEFLFIRGDSTARQSLQYIGQLLPVTAPFLFLGLIYLFKQKKWFWLVWLFLAPVPAALTYDGGYHATRLFMMIPPLAVSLAYGIFFTLKFIPPRLKVTSIWFLIIFIVYNFSSAASYYLYHYPQKTWIWWHVGFKDAITELNRLSSQYDKVFINNTYEPSLIRFLFYSNYNPREFQKNFVLDQPSDIFPGYYGFFLAPKYYFGGFSPPANKSFVDVMQPENLYMVSKRDDVPGNPPGGVKVLYTSTNPLGNPIFYLVTKE
jgi:hypothetical protein